MKRVDSVDNGKHSDYKIFHAILQRDAAALREVLSHAKYDGYSKLCRRNRPIGTRPSDDDEEYIFSPMVEVMQHGDEKCLKVLLDFGCEALLDPGTDKSFSAKHYACQKGLAGCLRVLLEKHHQEARAAPDLLHGKPFLTPLHTVIQYWNPSKETNYAECLEVLLEYKADPTRVDYLGTDVLTKACSKGLVRAVEILLKKGRVKVRTLQRTYSALHAAAASLNVELIQMLLDHKSRKKQRIVNTPDRKGNYPLHHVVRHAANPSAADAARCLLQAGTNVNKRNDRGDTALLMAMRDWQRGNRAVFDVLLEFGARVQDFSDPASTAPSSSGVPGTVAYREKIFVEAYLRHGKSIQQRGLIPREELRETIRIAKHRASGWTPLHYACFYGDSYATQKLLERGADENAKDGRGRKPIFVSSGLVLEASKTSPTDLDTVARRAHSSDVLPMEAEDLSLANNFTKCPPDRTEASAVSLLLDRDAILTEVDADGNLPFFFAAGMAVEGDLTTTYLMVKAGNEQGLFRDVAQGMFRCSIVEKNKDKEELTRHQQNQYGPNACVIL